MFPTTAAEERATDTTCRESFDPCPGSNPAASLLEQPQTFPESHLPAFSLPERATGFHARNTAEANIAALAKTALS